MRTSFCDYCVKQDHRALLAQWDEVRNAPLTPGNVSFGSHQKGLVALSCRTFIWFDRQELVRGISYPICVGRPLNRYAT